jgi:sec-independent protein translocase protein TatC
MTETAVAEQTVDSGDGMVMTVVEHLSELRRRIFIGILAVAIGAVVGFLLAPDAIRILKAPISGPLYFTAPSSAFFLQLKLALMIGSRSLHQC